MSQDTKKTAHLIATEEARKAQAFHAQPLKPKRQRSLPYNLSPSVSAKPQPEKKMRLALMAKMPTSQTTQSQTRTIVYLEKEGEQLKFIMKSPKAKPVVGFLNINIPKLTEKSLRIYDATIRTELSKLRLAPTPVTTEKLSTQKKAAQGKQLQAETYKEVNLPQPSLLLSAALFTLFTAAAAAEPTRKPSTSTNTPTYDVNALTSNCATGALWQSNSNSTHKTVQAVRDDKPGVPSDIHVIKTDGNSVSTVLGIKSTNGKTLQSLTAAPKTGFHDGRPTQISTVSGNSVDTDYMVIGIEQEGSSTLANPSFCNQTEIEDPPRSTTYASTYDMQVTTFAADQPLTSASLHTIKAPNNIPGKGEIDVTPAQTSLNIILKKPNEKDRAGMIKLISTTTKDALCKGAGPVPVNSTLAVYQLGPEAGQEYTVPEGARLVITNAGRIDNFISVNNDHGSQDLVLYGRNTAGQERLFVIQDYDQLEGSIDCDALKLQPTGWQEVLVAGQRDGLLNFSNRHITTVAGSPVTTPGGRTPNLFISTPDNSEATVWKIDLSAFSGQITLGQNGTTPIFVPVYHKSSDAVAINQSIAITDLNWGPQLLIVGQTYEDKKGTPLKTKILDTFTVFDAATGELRYVIQGGMDTWGIGTNFKVAANGGILAANINGQENLITLNLQSMEPGSKAPYFIAGSGSEYTLQCMNMMPTPSPTPKPTPTNIPTRTPKPTHTPTPKPPHTPSPTPNDINWWVAAGTSLGTLVVVLGVFAGYRLCAGESEETVPLNPASAKKGIN